MKEKIIKIKSPGNELIILEFERNTKLNLYIMQSSSAKKIICQKRTQINELRLLTCQTEVFFSYI